MECDDTDDNRGNKEWDLFAQQTTGRIAHIAEKCIARIRTRLKPIQWPEINEQQDKGNGYQHGLGKEAEDEKGQSR